MNNENSYFQEHLLSDERFKDWLVPAHTKREAGCKRCKKSFALLNMGIQALKSHAESKKYKQLCAAVAVFLKTKPVTKSTTSSPDLSPVSSTSSSSGFHVTLELKSQSCKHSLQRSDGLCKAYWKDTPIIHQAIFHLYSK